MLILTSKYNSYSSLQDLYIRNRKIIHFMKFYLWLFKNAINKYLTNICLVQRYVTGNIWKGLGITRFLALFQFIY